MNERTMTDDRKDKEPLSFRSSFIGHHPLRIGIDLDNTIIDYDHAFLSAARTRGLIPGGFSGNKQQVRDHIRTLPDGEIQWQKLQGFVYGQGIGEARLFDGVKEFFTRAKEAGHGLHIVSHKTEFGHYDETKTNLREAATAFLKAHGIEADTISYHATRAQKVEAISQLAPDYFIDDLVEVFEEKNFPPIRKILFHTAACPPSGEWEVCGSWRKISALF